MNTSKNTSNEVQPMVSASRLGQRLAILLAASALLVPAGAQGADRTWNGSTDANWNTAANWNEGAVTGGHTPVFGAAGTSGTTLDNDTADGTSYNGITFGDSADSFTIGGNGIILNGNIAVGTGITQQTINFPMTLNNNRTVTVNSGNLTLGGAIGQNAAGRQLTKAGAGALTLKAENTYTGLTTVYGGGKLTVDVGAGGSLSSSSGLYLGLADNYTGPGAFVVDNTSAVGATELTLASLETRQLIPNENTVQVMRTAAHPISLIFNAVLGNGFENGYLINFVTSDVAGGGVNGTDYKIVLGSGLSALRGSGGDSYHNINSQRAYFNGDDFAVYDPAGYVRGVRYGLDWNSATSPGGTSFANTYLQEITGHITEQATVTLGTATNGDNGRLRIVGPHNITMADATRRITINIQGNTGSSGILKTGGGTSTIGGGAGLTMEGVQGIFRVVDASDTLDIAMPVSFTGNIRLLKSGEGRLILSGGVPFNRFTHYINGGVLEIGGSTAPTTAAGSVLRMAAGAVFQYNCSAEASTALKFQGAGGVTVSAGTLALSDVSAFTGPTLVTDGGTLVYRTSGSSPNSAVSVAADSAIRVDVLTSGGQWPCAGLTHGAGTTALGFGFAAGVVPHATTAPLQVNGDLAFNGTLDVSISAVEDIPVGTYPLIKYTGALTGVPPARPVSLPAGMAATLVNNIGNKSIDLNVTPLPSGTLILIR